MSKFLGILAKAHVLSTQLSEYCSLIDGTNARCSAPSQQSVRKYVLCKKDGLLAHQPHCYLQQPKLLTKGKY